MTAVHLCQLEDDRVLRLIFCNRDTYSDRVVLYVISSPL